MIVVFGAAATATTPKRPRMGAVAAELADRVVVTSDNPRSERPDAIIAAVLGGIAATGRGVRRRAGPGRGDRDRPSTRPRPGDVVVVAGKGHETTQTIGDRVAAVRRPRGRPPPARGPAVITGRDGVSP